MEDSQGEGGRSVNEDAFLQTFFNLICLTGGSFDKRFAIGFESVSRESQYEEWCIWYRLIANICITPPDTESKREVLDSFDQEY